MAGLWYIQLLFLHILQVSFQAERERRRLRAQKKEMKRKELDHAKETEKNSWLKFNNKAITKGIKVCVFLVAQTG